MSIVAMVGLALLSAAAGWEAAGRAVEPGRSFAFRLVLSTLAGVLTLYVLLVVLQALGIAWSRSSVLPFLGLLAAFGVARGRRWATGPFARSFGWGDLVALAGFAVYVVWTVNLWNLNPDFVYHWGIKAQKYYLAGGIDFELLVQPWKYHLHPDYPNLLPSLFALTAIVAGSFDELAMALWSVLFLAFLLLTTRELLSELEVSSLARQVTMAVVGLAASWFGVGYLLAGGPDGMIALVLMTAAVPLVARPGRTTDLQIGWVAAFGAATKIEGMPLAAFLIGLHLCRRWLGGARRELLGAVVRAAGPSAVAIAIWALQTLPRGLLLETNAGAFRWPQAGEVLPQLFRSLLTPNWHLLPFVLFLLPLLIFARRVPWAAGACGLQLLFYLYVYMSAPTAARYWVETSAARLFYHLVPTVLVLAIATADRWAATADSAAEPAGAP